MSTAKTHSFDIGIEGIAKVCHEVNRAYCQSLGDTSQPSWEEAPEWQRNSAIQGVEGHVSGRIKSPRESHQAWLDEKKRTGWRYGPVKDPVEKTHPCFVPYDDLPPEQQTKDLLFTAVIKALT